MSMWARRGIGLTGALALVAALGAAASAKELRIGVRSGAESLDPHFSAIGTNVSAMKNIYDTLTGRDDNLQLVPAIAESWRTLDDTTWEFKLKPGQTFHDGSKVDAGDVVHSIRRIPQAAGPDGGLRTYVRRIVDATAADELTLILKTDSPAATLPLDVARLFVIPAEIAIDTPVADFNSGKAAIGSGPFKVVSWQPKGDMVVAGFAGWRAGAPAWEKVTFTEISNDSARVAALLSKRVDLINYAPPADVARIAREPGMGVFQGPSVYIFMLFPDFRSPTPRVFAKDGGKLDRNPMVDLRVRQAMSLAINREAIAARVMEGLAVPANQLVTKGFFGGSPDLPPLTTDVEKARALLAEAGWPNGFKVDLHCTSDRLPLDGDICAALGPMLARVGIDASVNATPRAVYFPAQAAGEYSLMMNGWGSLTGEASYILSSMVHTRDKEKNFGVFNHFSYSNPTIDGIVQEALGTLDADRRRTLLEAAMKLSIEDLMAIPIVNLAAIWAGNKSVATFNPRADEDTIAINAIPAGG